MAFLQSFFWFLVLIGIMILIHELGHFWAARWFDVRVDVFSIGFGPRLFGFRRGDTDYRISAIMFGGYVKMAGEQLGEDHADDPNGLLSKPRWQRLIIAFAGPFMNMVLAVGLLTGLFMFKYQKLADDNKGAVIGYVIPGGSAEKAGLKSGGCRCMEVDRRDLHAVRTGGLAGVGGKQQSEEEELHVSPPGDAGILAHFAPRFVFPAAVH